MKSNTSPTEVTAAQGSGIYTWVISTDTFYSDDFGASMFGFDRMAARRGMPLKEYIARIHCEDRARVVRAMQNTIEAGMPCNEQYRICRPDGSIQEVMGFGSCFCDGSGKPTHYSGIFFPVADACSDEGAILSHLLAAHNLADRRGWARLAEKIVDTMGEVDMQGGGDNAGFPVKALH